jgi:phosphate transport system substrate-binding protein
MHAQSAGHPGARKLARLSRAAVLRTARRTALSALVLACLIFSPIALAQQQTLKIGGTGVTLHTMRELAAAFEKVNPGVKAVVLSSLGSTGGIKAAISGAVDVGVSARPLTEIEQSQGASAVEYGRAPLVFAVARTTNVTDITTAQVTAIYAGRLTEWPGGTPIRLILRPDGDINTILLRRMSPQMREAVTVAERRPGMLFALTDQAMIDQIEKVPGAIGPTSLNEVIADASRLKALTLDGVEPSARSIESGRYPIYHTFYLITSKTSGAVAGRFVAFVRSEPGRAILRESGHWLADAAVTR